MTEVVVDTDVVSFVFKNHPFGSHYDQELAGHITLISFMTVAEIERWTLQYRWGGQRIQLLRTFLQRFTVVPSSPDLCCKWAEVIAGLRVPTPGSPPRRCFTRLRWLHTTAAIIWAYRVSS